MSLVKISELPPSTGIFPDYDVLPIVHGGVTVKITAQSMTDTSLVSPGPIGVGTPSTIAATSISSVGDATIAGFTVGKGTASISTNTVFGYHGLHVNTTGSNNTAISSQALYTNTTGSNNTAVGSASLSNNTTGANNTALGVISLSSATTGSSNIGIGYGAGSSVTTGSNNTIIGNLTGTTALSSTVLIGAGDVERLKVNSTGLYINGSLFTGGGGGSGTPVAVYGGLDNILTSTLASVNFIGEHGLVYNSFTPEATVTSISNTLLGIELLNQIAYGIFNDEYFKFDIPWNIEYFGESYNTGYICSNSFLSFAHGSPLNQNFASLYPNTPKILIASADNYTQGIYWNELGTTPDRTFVVRYEGLTALSGGGLLNVTPIENIILGPLALDHYTTPDVGNIDDGYYIAAIPWDISYLGSYYNTVYIGSNSYLTFSDGSVDYSDFAANSPLLPKILIEANDYFECSVYYGAEGVAPDRTFRIRYTSNDGNTESPVNWEATFYENDISRIDIQIGSNMPLGFSGLYSADTWVADLLGTSYIGMSITAAIPVSTNIIWEATFYENDISRIDIQIGENNRLDGISGIYTENEWVADLPITSNTGNSIVTSKVIQPDNITVDSTIRFDELNSLAIGGGLSLSVPTLGGSYNTDNIAIGFGAQYLNVTGGENIAIGTESLYWSNDGWGNVAIGYRSLYYNTTGYSNIATGSFPLYNNTTGSNNIATGYDALYNNTTGYDNIATGTFALSSNTTGDYNIATGTDALWNNTTGDNNIATGDQALYWNTTGSWNIATGYNALYNNTTGDSNIAIGGEALGANTTGNGNIGIGGGAGMWISTGNNNTIIGCAGGYGSLSDTVIISAGFTERIKVDAIGLYVNGSLVGGGTVALDVNGSLIVGGGGTVNTSGYQNYAIGTESLYYNTTGNNNIATGVSALYNNTSGYENIATGFHALWSNTTGNYNIATGHQSLYFNTTGYNNIATGRNTLLYNETGYENVATGHYALYHNTTGYANIAIGVDTLFSNTTGNSNIATGTDALYYNTTGSENIALGYNALYSNTTGYNNIATGPYALYLNTTGSLNIATGSDALWNNTTGTNNIATGGNALYNNTTGSYNVGIGIGVSSSSTTVSNEVNISNNTVTARFQGAASGWSFVSDQRDKTNVEDLTLGLDFINELRPRKFEWDLRHTDVDKGKVASGFIAQEVLAVVESNNAEYSRLVDTNDENQYTIAQTNLIPILVNAIKELTTEIEILKSKIDTLIP